MFFLCWIADCIWGRFHHIPGNFANPKCSVVQFKIGFSYKIQSLPLFSHCAGVAVDAEVGRGLSALFFFISPLSNMSVEIPTSKPPSPSGSLTSWSVRSKKREIKGTCVTSHVSPFAVGWPTSHGSFLSGSVVRNPPAMQETWFKFLGREDFLEKGMATSLEYSFLENSSSRGA